MKADLTVETKGHKAAPGIPQEVSEIYWETMVDGSCDDALRKALEQLREELLSDETQNAMEIEALDPLSIGSTPHEKRQRILEAALDHVLRGSE